MNKQWWVFIVLILGLVILFTYRGLSGSFFQQDEWLGFGEMIFLSSSKTVSIWSRIFPVGKKLSHFNPLASAIYWGEYLIFGLKFPFYAGVSIIFQFFNTFLVFYFTWFLLKKKNLALVSGLIFALNSFSHQAVTWVGPNLNNQACCLFVLLALVFLLKKHFLYSILAFAISLGFKEASFFLFLFLPFFWLLFDQKRKSGFFQPFFIFSLFYFGFRVWLFFSGQAEIAGNADLSQPNIATYLFRLIALPLRVFPQSFFSAALLLNWSQRIVFLFFPRFVMADGVANPFVVEGFAFDLICFVSTGLIFLFVYFIYRYLKKIEEQQLIRILCLSMVLIATSVLPFIFISGAAGDSPIFEPRHLYLTGIGSSLFLTITLFAIILKVGKQWLWLLLLPAFFFHYKNIRSDIKQLVADGELRKSILNQINASYPVLPQKVVFYTQSDTAYYGLADNETILPFQSGLGQTLLVWYYHHGQKFPTCMFSNGWLYEIDQQDYRFCQERGFGYFRQWETLLKAVHDNKLSVESVIGFEFRSFDNSLTDITELTREKLKESL